MKRTKIAKRCLYAKIKIAFAKKYYILFSDIVTWFLL